MISIIAGNNICTGCAACEDICPKKCISMKENTYGVLYPVVDINNCLNCDLCKKVCPALNTPKKAIPEKCYAAYQKDIESRKNSASGGIATAFYSIFIKKFNGVIYGVTANRDKVFYDSCQDINNLNIFRGSQYTQAHTSGIFKNIATNIKNKKRVLFIGCPCQVAACINFVKQMKLDNSLLYTIDLLCHGVPPQKYLNEELQYLSKKNNWSNYSKVTFRSNIKGRNYCFYLKYSKKNDNNTYEYSVPAVLSPYFSAFVYNISLRESCFNCKYSVLERCGDITIGDFIGLGKQINSPHYEGTTKNTSVIMVNNNKGMSLLQELDEDTIIIERPVEEAYNGAPSMNGAAIPSKKRPVFLKLYPKYGFTIACKKSQWFSILISKFKYYIKKVLKYEK